MGDIQIDREVLSFLLLLYCSLGMMVVGAKVPKLAPIIRS